MAKRKKTFANAPMIKPTKEELEFVKAGLTKYFENNPQLLKHGKPINQKVDEIINDCTVGWICAPRTFMKRIVWKSKWNPDSTNDSGSFLKTIHEDKLDDSNDTFRDFEDIPDDGTEEFQMPVDLNNNILQDSETKDYSGVVSAKNLRDLLINKHEKKFWQDRENYYKKEFEFNNSSDWSLLMQLLLEELTQYRLIRRRMMNEDEDLEFQLTSSYKRLIDAQKALGITREQREGATSETEGNIAQLAMIYEDKLKVMESLKEKDKLEEEILQLKHDNKNYPTKDIPSEILEVMSKIDEEYDDELIEQELIEREAQKTIDSANDKTE